MVLETSDSQNDVVKLMNINDFNFEIEESCSTNLYCNYTYDYNKLFLEYFNPNTTYKSSYIESIVDSFAKLIPVDLQEVNGYKIRLLSVKDILEYDSNWEMENIGKYNYNGTDFYEKDKFNELFLGTWLMDTVEKMCDNCSNFLTVRKEVSAEDYSFLGIYIKPRAIGLPNINPVIYASKESLK